MLSILARPKTIVILVALSASMAMGLGPVAGQDASAPPLPKQKPSTLETPAKRTKATDGKPSSAADGSNSSSQSTVETEERDDEGDIPRLPERAPTAKMRKAKIGSQNYGPPPPPDIWSERLVDDAKAECARLVSKEEFGFEALEPIKEGVCGTPAPIVLSSIDLTTKVEIRPSAKMTCPLADALKRWMAEVVQPMAKELLDDEIVGVTNVASYHCRTRYNDPTQRMSHHAFANAIDISEFIMAKGERITLTGNWNGDTPQSKFLKGIHKGACQIFGTVLGPDANDAHKSHFHLDMAKRRFSAYCQ